jgi:TRAP-type C4-dicarboxylate transport system permease small subunit
MKYLKNMLISLVAITGLALVAVPAGAVNVFEACTGVQNNTVCEATKTDTSAGDAIRNVVNVLLYLLGATAVIVIVVGGIMYSTSGGESANVTKAKNMIMYAVIGLVLALLAYAIVNFVIARFVP